MQVRVPSKATRSSRNATGSSKPSRCALCSMPELPKARQSYCLLVLARTPGRVPEKRQQEGDWVLQAFKVRLQFIWAKPRLAEQHTHVPFALSCMHFSIAASALKGVTALAAMLGDISSRSATRLARPSRCALWVFWLNRLSSLSVCLFAHMHKHFVPHPSAGGMAALHWRPHTATSAAGARLGPPGLRGALPDFRSWC